MERYKKFFENKQELKLDLRKDFIYPDFSIKKAYEDILNKKFSFSKEKLYIVEYIVKWQKYSIFDGWHRFIEDVLNKKFEILAELYRKTNFPHFNENQIIKINWNNPIETFNNLLKR